MARDTAGKPTHTITLELEAGNGSLMILGKMLGATGIKPFEVKKHYDTVTAQHRGEIIPAVITIDARKRWTMRLKTPPTASLIRKAAGIPKGTPGRKEVGVLTRDQLRKIAQRKLPDLNTVDIEAAMRIVAGTARSMGVRIVD
ncbi:uL11 family ribosomal protein [Nocardia camponoti]|uniref:Large ribosomal subunit protein uL11 n=1 Tax=Nocardia camponoti TaxID=1616106 RepID=A0A917QBZ1_9NOCA|nr:50S ribosomal protein L11 [Nocardia camponoti]GGK42595.1 50S ribosomal protein L11 [Nocardia camponoti]